MEKLPFGKKNYRSMVIGLVIIVIGFTLMSMDSDPHGFGTLGLTIGPLITVAGFIFEIFAILQKPDEQKKDSNAQPAKNNANAYSK